MVLKFVLQPIVENSINHGLTDADQHVTIRVSSTIEGGRCRITVRDDGVGIDAEELRTLRDRLERGAGERDDRQIGLSNIDRRLKLYYGTGAGLTIQSVADEHTAVTIVFPVDERERL